jgi:hypothetical protein
VRSSGEEKTRQQHADQNADGEIVGEDHEQHGRQHHHEDERGWVRRLLIEDQEKVPIETMIMIATRAGHRDLTTESPSTTMKNSSMAPATKVDKPSAAAGFHVDDRLADHGAAGHAADEAGGGVGDALADAFHVAVRRGVGEIIDDDWVISDSSRPTAATATE